MKRRNIIVGIGVVLLGLGACKKVDEVPPRSNPIIREYILPPPSFLTAEERALIKQEREEYNKL